MIAGESWGRYPSTKSKVTELAWRTSLLPQEASLLPYGMGKSYGDACLNDDGILISTRRLNHFISFDTKVGILACESGVTLAEILELIVPHGWFLPVTPGTKYITVGGAIANDVHGKNHPRTGTFCHHLLEFELLRSDGTRTVCSATQHTELFRATCGGIGVTGLVTWAKFKLRPITSTYLDAESIKIKSLEEAMQLLVDSVSTHEYSIASLNTNKSGSHSGSGYFLRGNHNQDSTKGSLKESFRKPKLSIPLILPLSLVNRLSITAFNALYFARQQAHQKNMRAHYDPFFYPQDAIEHWNYFYGPSGFLQYQCQLPKHNATQVLENILYHVRKAGFVSLITTLKPLGNKQPIGHLSFAHEGYTLAFDFPNTGARLLTMLSELDDIVIKAGGRLYLAKDARMSAGMFKQTYPDWEKMKSHLDPAFSSTMWRRLTQ